MSVMIVGGCPGCGKSSVSRLLADSDPRGVHIASDRFFDFLAHKLDPSLPEAKAQNETVVSAYVTAASIYADGGYSVYLDGVIGPWLFPLISPILPHFDFVLLHAPLDVALRRVAQRDGQGSATAGVVRRMHHQFSDIICDYQPHLLHTGDAELEATAGEIRSRLARGELRVPGDRE